MPAKLGVEEFHTFKTPKYVCSENFKEIKLLPSRHETLDKLMSVIVTSQYQAQHFQRAIGIKF
jgi:hypothetical protein